MSLKRKRRQNKPTGKKILSKIKSVNLIKIENEKEKKKKERKKKRKHDYNNTNKKLRHGSVAWFGQ